MKTTILTRARFARALALTTGAAALLSALATTSAQAHAAGASPQAGVAAATCSARYVDVKRVIAYGTSLYALYTSGAPVKTWLAVYKKGSRDTVAVGTNMSWHKGTVASPASLGTPSSVELEAGTCTTSCSRRRTRAAAGTSPAATPARSAASSR